MRFAATVALLTAVGGGGAFAAVEHVSYGNGVYWAISTMATVGSLTPHTAVGKIIAVVVMLVGIGAATLVIGAVAQRFFAQTVEHVELAEDDLLVQVRDISLRLQSLERALSNRRSPQTPDR